MGLFRLYFVVKENREDKLFRWFKRYRRYHVVYVYVKKGDTSPTIADQLIISDKKIDASFIHDLKTLAKSNYNCDNVVILNIIKL